MSGAVEFVKWGLPFLLLVAAAPYGLSLLTQVQIENKDVRTRVTKEEEHNIKRNKKLFDLTEEFWRLQKSMDTDEWQNVPIPKAATATAATTPPAATAAPASNAAASASAAARPSVSASAAQPRPASSAAPASSASQTSAPWPS